MYCLPRCRVSLMCCAQAAPLCTALRHPLVAPHFSLRALHSLAFPPEIALRLPSSPALPSRLLVFERDAVALPLLRLME
jgi:hypothetical protein